MNKKTPKVASAVITSESSRESTLGPGSRVVFRLVFLQILGSVILSLALYACFDLREALSALFGGMVAAVANLFFAGRLFFSKTNTLSKKQLSRENQQLQDLLPNQQQQEAQRVVSYFYRSVMLKFLFTLMMFLICIVIIKVSILSFMLAYLFSAVIINWLSLLIRDPQTSIDRNKT